MMTNPKDTTYFEIPARHIPGRTEENYKKRIQHITQTRTNTHTYTHTHIYRVIEKDGRDLKQL